jgi:hypothetical protein
MDFEGNPFAAVSAWSGMILRSGRIRFFALHDPKVNSTRRTNGAGHRSHEGIISDMDTFVKGFLRFFKILLPTMPDECRLSFA